MISKYNNFLFERLRTNFRLILESYVSGTSDFLNRLKFLSKEKGMVGSISSTIYNFFEKEHYLSDSKIKQNYFDLTDKEDMVSFLMHNKVPDDWDDESDPSLPYHMKGRGEIKIAKVIKYIVKLMKDEGEWSIEEPKDKDIEAFVNAYKATKATNFKFKLLKGDDISKYYNEKRYFSKAGSLGGSCMSDESKGTFKIYTKNEDKVQLLVLIDEESDKISGRAIVWKLKKSPCEAKLFMDRVYTNRDSDFFKFKQFAEENGYLYKTKMNSHLEDNINFRYKGSDVSGEVIVKLDGDARSYPFVDTMCFLSKDKKELSNLPSEDCWILHDVSGEKEQCEDCEGRIIFCNDCKYSDGIIDCDTCDGSGDTDSGKCVTCKGEGVVTCDHKDSLIICSDCGIGHIELGRKGIETKYNKLLIK